MNDSLADCKVAIVGLGLMGGSLATALRGRCAEIVGVDSNPDTLAFACAHDIVDRVAEFDAALECDVLVLAMPVRTILVHLRLVTRAEIRNPKSTVVIDLGSTKSEIVAAMQDLPVGYDPIGGHPLCGKESSGIEVTDAALFRGARFVLSPLPRTSDRALALARQLVAALGARPLVLDAATHDRLVATTSHLPYLLACALIGSAERAADDRVWDIAASGFRDTSRLAGSGAAMMSDILLTNRNEILRALSTVRAELDRLAGLIGSRDESVLRAALDTARERRAQLFKTDRSR